MCLSNDNDMGGADVGEGESEMPFVGSKTVDIEEKNVEAW